MERRSDSGIQKASDSGFVQPPSGDRSIITYQHESGPIPSVDVLRGYEEILPGAADRIISMAEKQQDHEIEERKFINRTFGGLLKSTPRLAFILLFFLLLGSFWMFYLEKDAPGYIGLLTTVAAALINLIRLHGPVKPTDKS
jgi:uncharacterized membrane protein